jgi:hypothetical protein
MQRGANLISITLGPDIPQSRAILATAVQETK